MRVVIGAASMVGRGMVVATGQVHTVPPAEGVRMDYGSWDSIWQARCDHVLATLRTRYLSMAAAVPVSVGITRESLSPSVAAGLEFADIEPDQRFGKSGDLAWIKADIHVPPEVDGSKLALLIPGQSTGINPLVWLGGQALMETWGADTLVPLTDEAVTGEVFSLLVETSAGPGAQTSQGGPVWPGVRLVNEPANGCLKTGTWSLCRVHDVVFKALMDFQAVAGQLPRPEAAKALQQALLVLDIEGCDHGMQSTLPKALHFLKPIIATSTQESTGFICVEHGGMWPQAEARRRFVREAVRQLTLCQRYPQHHFLCAQPQLLLWLKEDAPDIYARLVQAVMDGQASVDGAAWGLQDTTLSGYESQLRNQQWAKAFMKSEFGIEPNLSYLGCPPSLFGGDTSLRISDDGQITAEAIELAHRGVVVEHGSSTRSYPQGALTSQARLKSLLRRSEAGLMEMETWGALAMVSSDYAYDHHDAGRAWKAVLTNGAHGIVGGVGIRQVVEEAEGTYAVAIATAGGMAGEAQEGLTQGESGMTVFNPLPWPRKAMVALPATTLSAKSAQGSLPVQETASGPVTHIHVPPCGSASLMPSDKPLFGQPAMGVLARLEEQGAVLENRILRARFDAMGQLVSVLVKDSGQEFLSAPGNQFRLYRDVPSDRDAWDIDPHHLLSPINLEREVTMEVVAEGAICGQIRIKSKLHKSPLTQVVTLEADAPYLRFENDLLWQETHAVLKVAFPTSISQGQVRVGAPVGHKVMSDPLPGEMAQEVAHQQWIGLHDAARGVSVANDGKYAASIEGQTLALTLMRATMAPMDEADRGRQRFTYLLNCCEGPFITDEIERRAAELDRPITIAPGQAPDRAFVQINSSQIHISAIKPADDGSGALIIRLKEIKGSATKASCWLLKAAKKIYPSTIHESTTGGPLEQAEPNEVALDFGAFEVKTLRVEY